MRLALILVCAALAVMPACLCGSGVSQAEPDAAASGRARPHGDLPLFRRIGDGAAPSQNR